MSGLISIIVPIYNTERYLPKCIDSLIAQTYRNIEIILVDDGSSDNCSSICDEYAAKDSRVKVIHKPNGGASSARNAGLDIIQGELVTFVDSDDYIEPDAISKMFDAISNTNADIACMHANLIASDYSLIKTESNNTSVISRCTSNEYIRGMCRKEKSESVCDKLFRASLFEKNRFEQGKLNEDFFFLSKLLFADLKIAEVDYAGYNYYQREGSITHSGFEKAIVDAVKNSIELKELANTEKPELEKHFAEIALFQARVALLTMPWEYVKTNSPEYKMILESVKKCKPYIGSAKLSQSDKLFLRSVIVFPKTVLRITSFIWKIKSKSK